MPAKEKETVLLIFKKRFPERLIRYAGIMVFYINCLKTKYVQISSFHRRHVFKIKMCDNKLAIRELTTYTITKGYDNKDASFPHCI